MERRDKMLEHDFSAERATLEEVFDQSTRMVLFSFLSSGIINEVNGVVSAGKEARVYWGTNIDGKDLAVKIYLTSSAEFRKGMLKYIQGDYRFKGVKHDTRSLIYSWAQKEFRNLEQAMRAKVRVPKPVGVTKNVLVMEFIGEKGTAVVVEAARQFIAEQRKMMGRRLEHARQVREQDRLAINATETDTPCPAEDFKVCPMPWLRR